MAHMTAYVAKATSVGRFWHVEVAEADRSTLARSPAEAALMAADLIEAMTDKKVAPTDIEIT